MQPVPLWLMLAGIAALALGYVFVLRRLRRIAEDRGRQAPPAPAAASAGSADDPFTGAELERYARHIVLREIGGPGQRRLKQSSMLVVGAGGLGSPALLYLAAAGTGKIRIVDSDLVSLSNLQRQVAFGERDVGAPKAERAAEHVRALNSHVRTEALPVRLDSANADGIVGGFDVVLDCSDSFETREILNEACARRGIPLVFGAISQWEGQISVFHPSGGSACFACVFPSAPAPGTAPSCAEAGVLGALPGVIGSMMAAEAVKIAAGAGAPMTGSMLIYDALWGETRMIALERREDCVVCGGGRPPAA